MNNSILQIENHRGLCILYLNKPQQHNAFDPELILALTAALNQAEQDATVNTVVLAARGKNFSAGADLNWMQAMANYGLDENKRDAQNLAHLLQTLAQFPKPTMALVQGAAFGGAIGLIACCDLALAAEEAYFCLSEVKLGLVPAVISPYIIRALGERQARRYMLTAERFNASEAQKLGLIHQVVAEAQLFQAGEKLYQQLQGNCPEALAQVKRLVQTLAHKPIDEAAIAYTCEALAEARLRSSTQQRLKRFLTKKADS